MRKIYFLVLLSILSSLLLFSCKKENAIKPNLLFGTWKWIYTYSDAAPGPKNPLTPQNTTKKEFLLFNLDNTWKKIVNDTIVDFGKFSSDYKTITYFKNGSQVKTMDYYEIKNDTLFFDPALSGLVGGGIKVWVKQ